MILPAVGWVFLHQLAIKTTPTDPSPGQTDLGSSLRLSTQLTLGYIKLKPNSTQVLTQMGSAVKQGCGTQQLEAASALFHSLSETDFSNL